MNNVMRTRYVMAMAESLCMTASLFAILMAPLLSAESAVFDQYSIPNKMLRGLTHSNDAILLE